MEKIAVRQPHTLLLYVPETHRDFYELISIADLNKWLAAEDVPYRLGEDQSTQESELETTIAAGVDALRPVNRNQIIGGFAVKADRDQNVRFWDDKLSRPPEWLKTALKNRGRAGKLSTWDPAQVALCLYDKRHITIPQLDTAISRNFPEWEAAWREIAQDLR